MVQHFLSGGGYNSPLPPLPTMLPLFDQKQNKTPSSLKECVSERRGGGGGGKVGLNPSFLRLQSLRLETHLSAAEIIHYCCHSVNNTRSDFLFAVHL